MHTEEDLVMHGARLRCADHARASLDARMRHGRHLPKGTLHHFARTGRSGRAHFFLLRHRAHTQRHFVPSSEPGPHNLRNVFGLCCFHSERSACVGPPNGKKMSVRLSFWCPMQQTELIAAPCCGIIWADIASSNYCD